MTDPTITRRAGSDERRSGGSGEADAPGGLDGFAGVEADQAGSGSEPVGGAGHRLGTQASPLTVGGQRVTGEELDDRVVLVHPHLGSAPVRSDQPDPGPFVAVP